MSFGLKKKKRDTLIHEVDRGDGKEDSWEKLKGDRKLT